MGAASYWVVVVGWYSVYVMVAKPSACDWIEATSSELCSGALGTVSVPPGLRSGKVGALLSLAVGSAAEDSEAEGVASASLEGSADAEADASTSEVDDGSATSEAEADGSEELPLASGSSVEVALPLGVRTSSVELSPASGTSTVELPSSSGTSAVELSDAVVDTRLMLDEEWSAATSEAEASTSPS